MRDAVIVEAVRTPVAKGKASGALHDVHAVDLFAHSLRTLVEKAGIDPLVIDDVIGGCVSQFGEQSFNVTRTALLAAGYPECVPGITLDRQCGSSQQAVHFAAQGVMSGAYDVAVAGGVESMSRVPMGSNLADDTDRYGEDFRRRYPEGMVHQGVSAELIAAKWGISRTQMDEFALLSHERADLASKSGWFTSEIAPVKVIKADGTVVEVSSDEGIRAGGTLEKLSQLTPNFESDEMSERFPEITWSVTAGNSSQISDGSAALLIMTSEKAKELGLTPRARLHTFAVVGDDPLYMLTGPIPATARAIERSGLRLDDIDLFEVNEAFASVLLAWQQETQVDLAKVNVNGGAIALGHPLGGSGARLMTTMLYELERRGARYGMQTMCEGGGMANATIIERLSS